VTKSSSKTVYQSQWSSATL